jgi:ribosomal protein S18 acetylase RimI-like enzyme
MGNHEHPHTRADGVGDGIDHTASKTLIRYRPFRNADPPRIVSLWREQQADRSLAQPMSVDLFSSLVLSKPYFENDGLIVAEEDDAIVGFVHAGFGPTPARDDLSTDVGVICMLLVDQDCRRRGIGRELIARAEAYLTERGARVILAGGLRPWAPFYLGLYGGSELPGVLVSDTAGQACFAASGYYAQCPCTIYHRDVTTFRPTIDRKQMRIRRATQIENYPDSGPNDWWEACLYGSFDCTKHGLFDRASGKLLASAMSWGMELISARWGARAMGVVNVAVADEVRRQGHATYLLGDICRQAKEQGVAVVQTQTYGDNPAAMALLESFGGKVIDTGSVFRKLVDGAPPQTLSELREKFPSHQALFAPE